MGKKAGVAIGAGMAAGLVAAGVGKGLFDLGKKFDTEFDKIRVASGKTGKALDGLEDSFRNVVGSLPTDFGTAGDAVAGLNQRLGLTGKPLERLSRQIIQLSRITGTDVSENVESITRLFGDWSVSTEHQATSLDKLFRIQQQTGLSVSKNARLLVQFGAPLRQLGFDFDEASAMFGKFEKEGVNLQTILPGFRFGLKNLSKPTAEAGAMFDKLGVSLKKGPAVALQEVFDQIKKAPSDLKANEIAFAVFGKRAGPDMAAAVREGRFEYQNLIDRIDKGKDTIDKAERNTRDFAEQWQLLKNRVFVGLEPLASKVFDTIGDGMERLATADFSKIGADLNIDLSGVEADLREATKRIQSILDSGLVKFIGSNIVGGVRRGFQGVVQTIRGQLQAIAGVLKLIDDLLHLRFAKAWGDVKQIFRGGVTASIGVMRTMSAPMRELASRAGGAILSPLRGAWAKVKDIFSSGVSGSLGVLRGMAGAVGAIGARIGSALKRSIEARVGAIGGAFRLLRRVAEGSFGGIRSAVQWVIDKINDLKRLIPSIPKIPDLTPGFDPPGPLAKGGVVSGRKHPHGMAIVGEQGPELVTLPVGSRVHANPESQRMAKRMGIRGFKGGGTVKGASSEFSSIARRAWEYLDGRLGARRAQMPRVFVTSRDATDGNEALTIEGKHRTRWIRFAKGAAKETVKGDDYGLWSLVHEFAHTQQDPGVFASKRLAEGGATDFGFRHAKRVAQHLGMKYSLASVSRQLPDDYRTDLAWVLKNRDQEWLRRGQFKAFDSSGKRKGGPRRDQVKGSAGGLQPAARYLASTMRQRFGLSVSPQGGVRPGDAGSFHSVGKAVDLVGSKMRAGAEWVKTSGLYKTLLEGIHNPNLSADSGKLVSSGFWGAGTWAEHKDHIHLAASTITQKVKEGLKGTDGAGGPKAKARRITGKLSPGQMVTLAKRAGFPDPVLAAAVGYAESTGRVGAVGDGGDSLGLWQIHTPSHPKYDHAKLQGDALYNAKAALAISHRGKDFTPWTMFRNKKYRDYLDAKGAPLPKGTKRALTGNSKLDYMQAQLLDAEGLTPADPKDDIRWINRMLRYWRGVYRRNKAAGNSKRQGEARSEITRLREEKKTKREELEDENLFTLGELTEIGTGVNAFKIGGLQTTLDNIGLEKANASLTFPRMTPMTLEL